MCKCMWEPVVGDDSFLCHQVCFWPLTKAKPTEDQLVCKLEASFQLSLSSGGVSGVLCCVQPSCLGSVD